MKQSMWKNSIVNLSVLGFLLLIVLTTCGLPPALKEVAAITPPTPNSPSSSLGETLYTAHCSACHGVNLEGEADWKERNPDGTFRSPPHNETGHTWHHGDPTLLEAIRLGGTRFSAIDLGGTSPMPAFDQVLSEEEITAVLSYIKSSWPEDIQTMQEEATNRESANGGS